MNGPISDDDDPTRDDVRVRLAQELSVQVHDHIIKETVAKEITNKLVEAIALWAQGFNERGRTVNRHCRFEAFEAFEAPAPLATQVTDDASIPIEE
jgi:hypothetical protein